MGWMVAAAAAMIAVGSFELARSASSSNSNLRSEHAQSASGVPPDMVVLVSSDDGADGRIDHHGCARRDARRLHAMRPVLEAIFEYKTGSRREEREDLFLTPLVSLSRGCLLLRLNRSRNL